MTTVNKSLSYIDNTIVYNNDYELLWPEYIPDPRYLTLNQTTGGIITADKMSGYDGEIVTLSNTASSDYQFDSYSITGSTLTSNQFTFVGSDVTAEANFLSDIIATGTFSNKYTAGAVYYYIEGSKSGGVARRRGISDLITLGGEGRLMVYRNGHPSSPDYYGIGVINDAATAWDTGWASGKFTGLNYVSSIDYSYDVFSALVSANPTYYSKTVITWDPIRFCDGLDNYGWDGYWRLYRI
ncbi:MAG: hypothetical protein J6S85_11150 [Methanobrevibacter sp.]|nr:hypothetical protein [Methanobrevibacter sp.]